MADPNIYFSLTLEQDTIVYLENIMNHEIILLCVYRKTYIHSYIRWLSKNKTD